MSVNATVSAMHEHLSYSEKKNLYLAKCNITSLPELICPGSQQGSLDGVWHCIYRSQHKCSCEMLLFTLNSKVCVFKRHTVQND